MLKDRVRGTAISIQGYQGNALISEGSILKGTLVYFNS